MRSAQVLIVGAGPKGLVLALCLARQGIPFRIIDRNTGPGQASRAIAVQARTLEFYQQLGFANEVVARGIKVAAVHLREDGDDVATLSLGDLGEGVSPFPFALVFPQDDHERFLIGKLTVAGIAVEWGVELKEFTQDADGVCAVLGSNGAAEVCEAAYLCGCDGAHSRVRQGLALDFPGGTYDQPFYVADVEITGEFRTDIFVNLGAHGIALMFPVRSSGMQRLIGTVAEDLKSRTDLTFDDIRPAAERLLGVHVERVNWFSAYRVHHRVAACFRVGRAFIAGDAGHIHSPAGGQGMNTGIGDAVNLSWKLADVIRGRADPAILDTYESERIGFARALVDTTDRAFRSMVHRGRAGRFLRTWLVPRVLPVLTGVPAVRRALFATVSQIRIKYPGSALSEGKAGGVSGGGRMPWVPTSTGGNFDTLDGRTWRLHVYGTVGPALEDTAAMLDLPVDVFTWDEAAGHAGLGRDAAYQLRPDGHVAVALPDQDGDALSAFTVRHGLKFRHAA